MTSGKGINPVAGNDHGICCFAAFAHISERFAKTTDRLGSISFVQDASTAAAH
jgi:hypothetical protein